MSEVERRALQRLLREAIHICNESRSKIAREKIYLESWERERRRLELELERYEGSTDELADCATEALAALPKEQRTMNK